jgi:hypothetical protein
MYKIRGFYKVITIEIIFELRYTLDYANERFR